MKKIYTLFTAFIFCMSINAQTVHFEEDSAVDGSSEVCFGPFSVYAHVVNNTAATQEIRWTRETNDMPCDWTSSICVDALCYAPTTSTFTFDLDPNESVVLSVSYNPLSQVAQADVMISIGIEGAEPNDTMTYYATGMDCDGASQCMPSSIDDYLLENVSVDPNPVHDLLMINSIDQDVDLTIYDILGNVVLRQDGIRIESINVNSLTQGVYNVVLRNGQKFYSELVIKQ